MAEAISEEIKAPVFDMTSSDPSIAKDFDLLIIGTPVEGFNPAKEVKAFVEQLPKTEGKKRYYSALMLSGKAELAF
jgi:flavodoxin